MAIIRLTATAWLARESERVTGVLLCHVTREGMDVNELLAMLGNWGLHYTVAELQLLRVKLVTDGVIEIV